MRLLACHRGKAHIEFNTDITNNPTLFQLAPAEAFPL